MSKFGGCLIGYGLNKKDGSFKKVIFDKPIHNTITKHCLNNLLTFDGTDALPSGNYIGNQLSIFVKSSQTSDRYGVINFCALGDGTGETSINDYDLKHRVTSYTSTKKTGSGWCGTSINRQDAIIKMRVSHTHTITNAFTIKELGWYNAVNIGGVLNYTLSARVQLEEFIDVEEGDEFYSIYELTVGFQGIERFDDLAGLGSGYKVNAWMDANTRYTCFPIINSNGFPTNDTGSSTPTYYYEHGLVYIYTPWLINSYGARTVTSNLNKLKPFLGDYAAAYMNDGSYSVTVKNYEPDSFYREVVFTFDVSMTSGLTIYGFILNGTLYRFGSFDENDNFTPTPVNINGALKITVRQSWSTDLLSPMA